MIVPVDKNNESEWAALCTALWPDYTTRDILRLKAEGKFKTDFLYLSEGKAIAFMSLSLRHDYVQGTHSSTVGYLEGIYVTPEWRGKGIAKALVAHAKTWTMEQGCSELGSDVIYGNEASLAFHKKVGFREDNTIVCFSMQVKA